jgi:hypothetical protein
LWIDLVPSKTEWLVINNQGKWGTINITLKWSNNLNNNKAFPFIWTLLCLCFVLKLIRINRRNLQINDYTFSCKRKKLVIIDTCDKPCNCFRQVTKENQSQKNSHGMYNHISSYISFATTWIFHPFTNHRIMQLHIQLHKILGSIF